MKQCRTRRRTHCSERNKVWTPSRQSPVCWRCGRLSLVSLHQLCVLNRPSNLSNQTPQQVRTQRPQTFPNSKKYEFDLKPDNQDVSPKSFAPQARLITSLQEPHLFRRYRHPYKACRRRSDFNFLSFVILTGFKAPTTGSFYQKAAKERPLILTRNSSSKRRYKSNVC
jgi:hypothetical protein